MHSLQTRFIPKLDHSTKREQALHTLPPQAKHSTFVSPSQSLSSASVQAYIRTPASGSSRFCAPTSCARLRAASSSCPTSSDVPGELEVSRLASRAEPRGPRG